MFFLQYFYLFNIKVRILVPALEIVLQIYGVFCAKTFIRRKGINLIKQVQEKYLLKLELDNVLLTNSEFFKLHERRKPLILKSL